jgi:hypothetical protein
MRPGGAARQQRERGDDERNQPAHLETEAVAMVLLRLLDVGYR